MHRVRAWMNWGVVVVAVGVLVPPPGAGLVPSLGGAEEERVIQGEIVDPAVYLKEGLHGPEMVNQTFEALDGGQTLALLEDSTDTLYLLLAEEPGEDPNELVYDYVNQRLNVTGTVYERAGVKGIAVKSVELLAAADATTVEPQSVASP